MKQCKRCYKINPAEIHTCTPGMRNKDGSYNEDFIIKNKLGAKKN